MNETLISFETAKLAKEKGFNEGSENYYENNGNLAKQWPEEGGIYNQENDYGWELDYFEAPTQSLLQKWLREIHNVFINIGHRPHSQKFYFTITGKYNEGEKGMLYDYDYKKYETYEASLEAGLCNALQLIK